MMKALLLISLCSIFAGCASYDVAKPISPESGWDFNVAEVDSLQPVLSWEPEFEGDADLVIFKGPYTKCGFLCYQLANNPEEVLYVETNIPKPEHKVKVELEPERVYSWAVRPSQNNDKEKEWSNYEYFAFYGIAFTFSSNLLFKFKTPDN